MAVESFILNHLGIISLISFLCGMFFIEETLFTVSFLSSQNIVRPYNIIFAFSGVIFCNILLYFVGRFKLIKPMKRFGILTLFLKKLELKAKKLSKNRIERSLFFSKFIMSGRLILTMILGYRGVSFKKFFFKMVLVEIVWASISITIAFLVSESYEFFSRIFNGVLFIITFFIILSFIVFYIKKKINQNI